MSETTCAMCKHWMVPDGNAVVGECSMLRKLINDMALSFNMNSAVLIIHCITFNFGDCTNFKEKTETQN